MKKCTDELSGASEAFKDEDFQSCLQIIFGNLRMSSGDNFQKSFVTFENLQRSLGDLRHSSEVLNFGNFRNTSDVLQKPLGFSRFLQTNFGNLCK